VVRGEKSVGRFAGLKVQERRRPGDDGKKKQDEDGIGKTQMRIAHLA
jgi:hypothetical protein